MKKALETVKKKEDRRRFDRKGDKKFYNRSSEKVENKKAAPKAKAEEVKEVKPEVKKAEKVDLSTKTVAELREMAKAKGIKGISTMKKAELIDALN